MAGIIDVKGEEDLSGVRANWHSGVTAPARDDDSDPFDSMNPGQTVLTAQSSPDQFKQAFTRLNRRINSLYSVGITCPLREEGECHCASCPISQLNNPDAERHPLCKQGVEEERVIMLARVAQLSPSALGAVVV